MCMAQSYNAQSPMTQSSYRPKVVRPKVLRPHLPIKKAKKYYNIFLRIA